MHGCILTDNTLQSISTHCHNLQILSLTNPHLILKNEIINPTSHNYFMPRIKLNNLKALLISDITHVDHEALEYTVKNCPNLEALDFNACNIQDEDIKTISTNCHKLQFLTLTYCNSLQTLNINLPTLQTLNLENCKEVQIIGGVSGNLKTICVSNCEKTTKKTFTNIFKNCQSLEIAYINNTHAFTEETLSFLQKNIHLKELMLTNTHDFETMSIKHPYIEKLIINTKGSFTKKEFNEKLLTIFNNCPSLAKLGFIVPCGSISFFGLNLPDFNIASSFSREPDDKPIHDGWIYYFTKKI